MLILTDAEKADLRNHLQNGVRYELASSAREILADTRLAGLSRQASNEELADIMISIFQALPDSAYVQMPSPVRATEGYADDEGALDAAECRALLGWTDTDKTEPVMAYSAAAGIKANDPVEPRSADDVLSEIRAIAMEMEHFWSENDGNDEFVRGVRHVLREINRVLPPA